MANRMDVRGEDRATVGTDPSAPRVGIRRKATGGGGSRHSFRPLVAAL